MVFEREKMPAVPALPETKEELYELLEKELIILDESRPVAKGGGVYHPGGIAVTSVRMKCPFCQAEFDGIRESGCFGGSLEPFCCPNCRFPSNILEAVSKLEGIKTNQSQEQKKKEKLQLEVDKDSFVDHVRRICCKNIRVPAKICLACPFREYVLNIMRERHWKLPKGVS